MNKKLNITPGTKINGIEILEIDRRHPVINSVYTYRWDCCGKVDQAGHPSIVSRLKRAPNQKKPVRCSDCMKCHSHVPRTRQPATLDALESAKAQEVNRLLAMWPPTLETPR